MSDMGLFLGADTPYRQWFFTNYASGAAAVPQAWLKPRGLSMLYFLVVSAGGGGGGGLTGTAGTARGGGAGGGPGGYIGFVIPAFIVPETLYMWVGKGGAASTGSGVAGTAGDLSAISMHPSSTGQGLIFLRVTAGNGGAAGTGSGAASGGSAGGTPTWGNAIGTLGMVAISSTTVSLQTGGAGGTAAGGQGGTVTVGVLCAGAGGGGATSANFAGGDCSTQSTNWYPSVVGGAAGSNRGQDGFWTWGFPFTGGFGGTGGGAANSAAGGAGGNGAYGCGGGGGGAGTTGGAGGRGGDGLVLVMGW